MSSSTVSIPDTTAIPNSFALIDGRVAGQAKCTQSCGLFSHGVPFRLIFRHGLLAFA